MLVLKNFKYFFMKLIVILFHIKMKKNFYPIFR